MNDVLKPYVLLACVAFIAGFVGYLALDRILISPAAQADDWQASIPARAAPADEAPLAHGKRI